MAIPMGQWIPRLRRYHIEDCSHWTQQECPALVNAFLVEWLQTDAFSDGHSSPLDKAKL